MEKKLSKYTHVRCKKSCWWRDDPLQQEDPFIIKGKNYKLTSVLGTIIFFDNEVGLDHKWDTITEDFDEYLELISLAATPLPECKSTDGSIKSDGGSSDYYKLLINNIPIETEDIIRDVFGNDFDFGNAFKSLVRAYKTQQGCGKEGNDISYECNKIKYSVNKIRKQGVR